MSTRRGAVEEMENFGLRVQTYVFPEQINDSDFRAEFSAINRDRMYQESSCSVRCQSRCGDGIEKMIDPEKDLDGIPRLILQRYLQGTKPVLRPVPQRRS